MKHMGVRQILLCSLSLIALAAPLPSQGAPDQKDLEAYAKACRAIRATLKARASLQIRADIPNNDDFAIAGLACDQLDHAIATHTPAKIQSAASTLRAILAKLGQAPATAHEQLAALEEKASGLQGEMLFYELGDLAKRAFNAEEIEKARGYSQQLLEMAAQYPKDWNYGNAIYYGNFVLGRIALKEGNLLGAGQYLLAAGATPGSPQLNSFGPNVTLAKELLEKGQVDVVLQYFLSAKNSGRWTAESWMNGVLRLRRVRFPTSPAI
jgi:hypothetical protein